MSPHSPFPRGQDQHDRIALGDRSIGQDLDNIFRLTAAPPVALQPAPERAPTADGRRVTQPDLDAALDMLTRAAKAMDAMQARYQHVEDYAKSVAERAEKDIAAAYAQVRDCEVKAAGLESQLDEFRNRAAEAERRAADAEHRSAEAERQSVEAQRDAKEAREWLECFYDKITNAFDTRSFLKSKAA